MGCLCFLCCRWGLCLDWLDCCALGTIFAYLFKHANRERLQLIVAGLCVGGIVDGLERLDVFGVLAGLGCAETNQARVGQGVLCSLMLVLDLVEHVDWHRCVKEFLP